jgi:dipeptidase E
VRSSLGMRRPQSASARSLIAPDCNGAFGPQVAVRPVIISAMEQRRLVAMGGGGFSMEPENPLLDEFVLSLARSPSPRVCFVPTASGDAEGYVARFFRAFSALDCRPTDLQLFNRTIEDLQAFVLDQDVIYVGGGNTANMLAVWRAHGLDRILARAWAEGVVLCGLSAGMNCWFEESVTDSYCLAKLARLSDGLGLLPGSCCPHYDGEEHRRPAFHRFIESGQMSGGWAADDGAALVFSGTALNEVVSSRDGAAAYRVEKAACGVSERRLAARYLAPLAS